MSIQNARQETEAGNLRGRHGIREYLRTCTCIQFTRAYTSNRRSFRIYRRLLGSHLRAAHHLPQAGNHPDHHFTKIRKREGTRRLLDRVRSRKTKTYLRTYTRRTRTFPSPGDLLARRRKSRMARQELASGNRCSLRFSTIPLHPVVHPILQDHQCTPAASPKATPGRIDLSAILSSIRPVNRVILR